MVKAIHTTPITEKLYSKLNELAKKLDIRELLTPNSLVLYFFI
jgi:hypothetical protein